MKQKKKWKTKAEKKKRKTKAEKKKRKAKAEKKKRKTKAKKKKWKTKPKRKCGKKENMAEFQVAEKFVSINGEGRKAGQLAVFIRFLGCNLSCSYCDTAWAREKKAACERMTEGEILKYIRETGVKNVTLTGGEPLLQKDIMILLELLAKEEGLLVEIETNGSISLKEISKWKNRPSFTMDYKLPGSGMEQEMKAENAACLSEQDTVKFVIGSREDFFCAKEIIEEWKLKDICAVYLSTVFGKIEPKEIVELMIEHQMNGVNLQLQLHKYIWDPQMRGV